MSWGTELWVSAGPRNGPRGGGSGPGLHRAEITEQTNEPRRAALRSGGGLGCFIFWCVCVCVRFGGGLPRRGSDFRRELRGGARRAPWARSGVVRGPAAAGRSA